MQAFPIPVVALGPGSQPDGASGLDYVSLPRMELLRTPLPPEHASPNHLAATAAVLDALLACIGARRPGADDALDIAHLEPGARAVLDQCLGDGEVVAQVRAAGGAGVRAQETAFAGVWRVCEFSGDGAIRADRIEIGAIPAAVAAAAGQGAAGDWAPPALPPGLMNAPAVLREIEHRLRERRSDDAAHVINLTLLPMTPADLEAVAAALGWGPVTLLSRGFGNCRIESTRAPGVWRVRYFNSMDTVILDTIEIATLPEVALAAESDIADSALRLAELAGWVRDGAAS